MHHEVVDISASVDALYRAPDGGTVQWVCCHGTIAPPNHSVSAAQQSYSSIHAAVACIT